MRMRSLGASGLLALFVLSCASGGPGLNYGLDPGDQFTVTVTRRLVNDRTIGENRMVDTTATRSVDRFEVTDTRPDAVQLKIEYGERSAELSRFPDDPPDFGPLQGQKASFWLGRTGDVSGFEGFLLLPMISFPGDEFNAKRYEMELEMLYPHLPAEPLEPGQSWEHHEEVQDLSSGMPIDIVLDYTYTLEGPVPDAPGLLAIDCTYTVSVSGAVDAGDFFLDLNMSGEGNEKIRFDPVHHMIMESSGTMSVAGEAVNDEAGFRVPLRNDHVTEIRTTF